MVAFEMVATKREARFRAQETPPSEGLLGRRHSVDDQVTGPDLRTLGQYRRVRHSPCGRFISMTSQNCTGSVKLVANA